jgi:hypothetical protein
MNQPTQCRLWRKENLTEEDIDIKSNFEMLHTFTEESHLSRDLLKCKECGQLYFYEFYEEIDWKEGKDPQYCTFIPIETQDEAKDMAKMSPLQLLQFSPRLLRDWPDEKDKPEIRWIGKKQ